MIELGFCKSVANFVVCRGIDCFDADLSSFLNPLLYPSWSTEPLLKGYETQQFMHHEKMAAVWRYLFLKS